jgi:type II secretory pathway pseudopilin PulG
MSRTPAIQKTPRTGRQGGYVLLLVVFLVATMMLFAVVAAPRVLTQGRRAKEDELIWRGEQYDRAIRLYFRKSGRFATSLDDLSKGVNGLHFLRKPYKDPMNPNGDWRLIYITPAGTLVGSIRYHTLAELTAAQMRFTGGPPLPPSTPGVLGGGASSQGPGASSAGGAPPSTPRAPTAPGASPDQSQQTPQGQQPQQGQQPSSAAPSGGTEEAGPVIGGNIIGVASKVNKRSLKVYQGGKTYREWEFIWNPMAQVAVAVQPGATPNQPGQGQPGPSPFGLNPQTPVPNMPQPPQPQNPPQ